MANTLQTHIPVLVY